MAKDYQAQVTDLYNKLTVIDSQLSKFAQKSYVNTVQVNLTTLLNNILGDLNNMTIQVQNLKNSMADVISRG